MEKKRKRRGVRSEDGGSKEQRFEAWRRQLGEERELPRFSDLRSMPTRTLVDVLRQLSTLRRAATIDGDDQASLFHGEEFAIGWRELKTRADGLVTFEAMMDDDDPWLRFRAAAFLLPRERAMQVLERLSDEGLEPEASDAREHLQALSKRHTFHYRVLKAAIVCYKWVKHRVAKAKGARC